jgi:hypothetical protein
MVKRFDMKNIATKIYSLAVATLLIGCAASEPFQVSETKYQKRSGKALASFADGVSRGFKRSGSSSSRGMYDMYGGGADAQGMQQPYGGHILKSAMEAEVQDCMELVSDLPKSCETYNYMVSSLTRCLDRVVSYRNPLMTYAYRHLDDEGKQYWGYLLNWRRPQTFDLFLGGSDMMTMDPFATQGYVPNDI